MQYNTVLGIFFIFLNLNTIYCSSKTNDTERAANNISVKEEEKLISKVYDVLLSMFISKSDTDKRYKKFIKEHQVKPKHIQKKLVEWEKKNSSVQTHLSRHAFILYVVLHDLITAKNIIVMGRENICGVMFDKFTSDAPFDPIFSKFLILGKDNLNYPCLMPPICLHVDIKTCDIGEMLKNAFNKVLHIMFVKISDTNWPIYFFFSFNISSNDLPEKVNFQEIFLDDFVCKIVSIEYSVMGMMIYNEKGWLFITQKELKKVTMKKKAHVLWKLSFILLKIKS